MSGEPSPSWEAYDPKARLLRFVAVLLTLVVVGSWRVLGVRYNYVSTAPEVLQDLLVRMYPPDVAYSQEIVGPLIETINIAILGTGLAVVMALRSPTSARET